MKENGAGVRVAHMVLLLVVIPEWKTLEGLGVNWRIILKWAWFRRVWLSVKTVVDSTYLRCVWFREGRGFLDSVRLTAAEESNVITAQIFCCGRSSMQRVFLHGCRVLREIKSPAKMYCGFRRRRTR